MSNIFIQSFNYVKKYFLNMLLFSLISCILLRDSTPVKIIVDFSESLRSEKIFIGFSIITIVWLIISIIVSAYFKIEIYNAIKEGRSPSVIVALKNVIKFDSDMIKLILMIFLKTFLWSLLFIIPGIIKSLEYQRAIYIKASDPNVSNKDCFVSAKYEMDGRKLSLFGWILLSVLIPSLILIVPIFIVTFIFFNMHLLFGSIIVYTIISSIVSILSCTIILTIEPMFNNELDLLLN